MQPPRFDWRPVAVALLIAGLWLVAQGAQPVWATPAQAPAGQTVPTPTPAPRTPTPTARPSNDNNDLIAPSSPLPTGGVRVAFVAGTGVQASSLTRRCQVTVQREVLPPELQSGGTLEIVERELASAPPTNGSFAQLMHLCDIRMYDARGNLVLHPRFSRTITVCFSTTAADLASVAGDPRRLAMRFYDTLLTPPAWVELPMRYDPATALACAPVDHLTLFAVTDRVAAIRAATPTRAPAAASASGGTTAGGSLAAAPIPVGLPDTSGEIEAPFAWDMWPWAAGSAIALGAMVLALLAARPRRAR